MAVCADYGIAHSAFLSWSVDDRDKALWWEMHRRSRCPQCGTRADEWDPALGGHDDAYVAELRKCWGCAAQASMSQQIREDMGGGVTVALVRRDQFGR